MKPRPNLDIAEALVRKIILPLINRRDIDAQEGNKAFEEGFEPQGGSACFVGGAIVCPLALKLNATPRFPFVVRGSGVIRGLLLSWAMLAVGLCSDDLLPTFCEGWLTAFHASLKKQQENNT